MIFNSFHFIYFFIIVTSLYFALPHRQRWLLLLLSSCYFYMAFVPIYILILGFTIVVDYFAGIYIENAHGKRRKLFLIYSLVANIGILCIFKYYNFINTNFSYLLHGFGVSNPIPYLSILLPIGLSFHTFQAMSYTIEVLPWNGKVNHHDGVFLDDAYQQDHANEALQSNGIVQSAAQEKRVFHFCEIFRPCNHLRL